MGQRVILLKNYTRHPQRKKQGWTARERERRKVDRKKKKELEDQRIGDNTERLRSRQEETEINQTERRMAGDRGQQQE